MSTQSTRTGRALFAAAVFAASFLAVSAAPAHAVVTTKTELQYFLSPHPDDIFEGWSLAQDSSANYPVFITLTKGESTGYCRDPYNVNINLDYWGTFNRATPEGCKGARMGSLHNWLDDQSAADPYLNDFVRAENPALGYNMTKYTDTVAASGTPDSGAPTVGGMTACFPAWAQGVCSGANPNVGTTVPNNLNAGNGTTLARDVTWYVGSTSARVDFDLGDGNLTDAEVVWAFTYVRSKVGSFLPQLPEYGVVAAAYSNLGHQYTACTDYSHHDHRAVQEAVYNTDLFPEGGTHPQWGTTCGSQTTTVGIDTDALPSHGGRANMITTAHYNENMSTSTSYFQNRFRWLNSGLSWGSATDPVNGVIFAKWNYFWRRF